MLTFEWKFLFNATYTFELPISALQLRCRAWYGSLGLIPGPIWKMPCNNLLSDSRKLWAIMKAGGLWNLFENSSILWILFVDKGNNKIIELRTILQRKSQNSQVYKQTKSVNNRKTVKNLPRDSFKIFFGKNVVLYEIYSKKMEGDEY
jgi:hypothetical protein